MKKFETLKAGLGNGLIIRVEHYDWAGHEDQILESFHVHPDKIATTEDVDFYLEDQVDNDYEFKPHLFNLSDLNKPIRVEGYNDGEEFVTYDKLFFGTDERVHQQGEWFLEQIREGKGHHAVKLLPYFMVLALRKMKFNTEGLDESDYIDASKSKVYEPK